MNGRRFLRVSGWGQILVAVLLALALMLAAAAPALAHKDHQRKQAEAARSAKEAARPADPAAGAAPAMTHAVGGEVMDGMPMRMDRSQMSFFARLVDWFGRLHPLVVHFPIAFFPAALITAIAGKKRASFAAPVQFLVVAGGIFAPIAAGAGWLAAMGSEPEPVLDYHRWLGVGIGLSGAALAIWAWRKPSEDRGAGMILALALMMIAIAVQGFLGAGLTHGMEHMTF